MPAKISLKTLKKVRPEILLRLIENAKTRLKKDETMQRICKEYGQSIDIIDLIPTRFKELDVSAKTDHGIVYLNYALLEDGDFSKDYSYLIHEYSHFFQQCFNAKPTRSANDGDYLENPYEQEGFQNQVEYIANHYGDDEAEGYVDDLLDHHEITKKTEKEDLKDVLLDKV
jgi:hypothetical protein